MAPRKPKDDTPQSSAFDDIEKEKVYNGGRYIKPGRYRMAVNQVTLFESQQQIGKEFFCAEFTILHTTSSDYGEGDSVSWLQPMDKQVSKANCLKFALALNPGSAPGDITKTEMLALVGPENPAEGLTVDCEAFIAQSKAGRDFTKLNWSAASGDWISGTAPTSTEESVPF